MRVEAASMADCPPLLLKFAEGRQAIFSATHGWRELAGAIRAEELSARTFVIITHPALRRRFGAELQRALQPIATRIDWLTVPAGETSKSLAAVERLYAQLSRLAVDRTTVLVAFGGGVITDLVGFVAATFLRGLAWIALPTTLVAQLDSAIGGKVGVNVPQGKNLIGAIWPARIVFNNLDLLESLPAARWREGAVEGLKCGLLGDRRLVQMVLRNTWRTELPDFVRRAIRVKYRLVRNDLREQNGTRIFLNLGHTIGHALEVWGDFSRISHGDAVGIGLRAVAELSHRQGWCAAAVADTICAGVDRLGVPRQWPAWSAREWARCLTHDKKRVNRRLQLVTVAAIGRPKIQTVDVKILAQWLAKSPVTVIPAQAGISCGQPGFPLARE